MATVSANHPISKQFADLKKLVAEIEPDVEKFDNGNHAAGTRVRKAMQAAKVTAQGIRETVVQK